MKKQTLGYEITDSKGFEPVPKRPPMANLLDEIEGIYWTYPQAAKIFGVSRQVLVRTTKGTQAPSKVAKVGKRHVWLFTNDDMKLIQKLLKADKVKWEHN